MPRSGLCGRSVLYSARQSPYMTFASMTESKTSRANTSSPCSAVQPLDVRVLPRAFGIDVNSLRCIADAQWLIRIGDELRAVVRADVLREFTLRSSAVKATLNVNGSDRSSDLVPDAFARELSPLVRHRGRGCPSVAHCPRSGPGRSVWPSAWPGPTGGGRHRRSRDSSRRLNERPER